MKFRRWAILLLFFAFGCSALREQNVTSKEQSVKSEKEVFFVSVPIAKFSSFECPCVNIEIEGKEFLAKLDLGFQGDLAIAKEPLTRISAKTFVKEKSMYGVRGKEYKKKLYRIPKAKIGVMAFSPLMLQEESEEFLKDAQFLQNEEDLSAREEEGALGWELFYNANLLIDMKNSQIAFCDSLDTLKERGYAVERFTKVPLLLERGLVEFEAETPNGPLRCMLDTGSTWNIFNIEFEEQNSSVWEPENILKFLFFKIGKVDFGPISFHQLPIRVPIPIAAILGVEFFKTHLVFLDFVEKTAYFESLE